MSDTPTPSPFATDGQRTTDAECWMNYCLEAEKELKAAREELVEQIKLNKSLHYACVEVIRERDTAREQRDRLAEALSEIDSNKHGRKDGFACRIIAKEALQSLNQNSQANQPQD